MQKLQALNHMQQDVDFFSPKCSKSHLRASVDRKFFWLAIARHERQEDAHDFYNRLTPLVEIEAIF
jgi:hypothetical protein